MANKEKIDYLLLDIRELEKRVAEMRDIDLYPVSFFSETYELTHKLINELHHLEISQVEMLKREMEAHRSLIDAIPHPEAMEQPIIEPVIKQPVTSQEQPVVMQEQAVTTTSVPEVEAEVTPIESAVSADKPSISLNEVLEKQNLSDFRKAFSLNDRFRFRRELFDGNEEHMNRVINDLNELHSYEESIAYLQNQLNWGKEDTAVADFIKLIEKRFH